MSDEPREPAPAEPAAAPRRRPGRVRRWVVRPFFWALLLLVALAAGTWFFIQSQLAREKVRQRLIAPVSRFLGRDVRIGSIDYSFFPPEIELRDVVVPGPLPTDPPVLRAPLASLRVSIKDLRGKVFDIQEIEVFRPQVYLQFNPDGSSNLPSFRFSSSTGPKRFDVRIGHILVQDGSLRINERSLPFHLDAKAIWGRAIGRAERNGEGGNRLDLLATAQEVVTTLPRAKPYKFTVSAKGSVIPEQGKVVIASARLAGPDLTGRAEGFVDYRPASRRVELNLQADGAVQWVNRVGYAEEPLVGPVAATARFVWTPAGWSYGGTASSPRFATLGRVIEEIRAKFTGNRDGVDVQLENARYAGGSIQGLVSVDTAQKGPGVPVSLDLDLAGLSIHQLLADQFPGEELPIVGGLSGRTGGTFEYRFNSERVLAGSGRAALQVRGTSETGLPVAGDLPIAIDRGVISGRALHLTLPGQDVTSSGFTYDLLRGSGQLDFRLASRDVGPLGPVLLGPPKRGEAPDFWLPTVGRGTAEGTFKFAGKDYSLRLVLDLQDVVAPVTAADTVRGSFSLSPRALEDLRLDLTRGGGALLVTGRVPLAAPGQKVASQPFNLAIDAAQWQASGLAYLLGPELTRQFQGELSGRVDLAGTPERLTGRVDATVADLVAYGYPLGKARAAIAFNGGQITVEQGQVETPAGTVFARGSFDQATEAMNFTVLAPALALAAAPLRAVLGGELAGTMSVEAAASGTLRQPQATVSIRGRDLALQGRSLGQQGETTAVATWDGQRLDVRGSLLGLASFQGNGRLDRQGADVAIDLRSDNLGTLARAFSPQPLPDFTGSLVGTTALTADFGAGTWHAAVRLPDLRLQYQGRTIASKEPVLAELSPQGADIKSFYLAEPGTENELVVSGTAGFAAGAPLRLSFQSTLAATWAGLFLPADYRLEGAVDLLGVVRGTASNPSLSGEGEVRGGRLIVPSFAQSIDDINGSLSFNQNRISIDGVQARLGNNGKLLFTGGLDLPRPGRGFAYQITVKASDVSARFPEFLNNRGDATLSLISSDGGRVIQGDIRLERSLYVQDINVDLIELIQGLFQRQRLELAETGTFETTTQLNIGISGPHDVLHVRNNVANLQGDVRLDVRGTLAKPVIFGDVSIDPGGTLVYNDNEYQVQRGALTFSNPNRIDPVIDLVATTEVQGFNITLNLGGTLERPDIHLASDANLADLEIFSLIAGSQRPTESPLAPPTTADQQAPASQLAREFLYGQAASAISKRVGTLFRFDRFRIDPVVQAGQPVSGVGITVGKRLSKDVFITYSTLPTTGQQYIAQVEWRVRNNLTLVLTQVGDGTYAIDAQWQRRF
ncbi:MAG TPA: translocation/assembly module TamB domain-containing protein [Thermoanaerobaculia bacterium]|nr:translocation/assembly module TamB domain-containing protein [Thermoanaerobaculia bacterium]